MATYHFPDKAIVNRTIPKTKFYEHATISRAIKEAFVSQIQQIIWSYKLSPETINLLPAKNLNEIEVFDVHIKTSEIDNGILQSIDRAIPHPIIYRLCFEDRVRTVLAYKRINESDDAKWVVEQYFSTEWMSSKEIEVSRVLLPVALDMSGLYDQILKSLIPIAANDGEDMRAHTGRLNEISQKQKEIIQLQSKMRNEKQFNRKVEMNAQLKALQSQLNLLQS